jgi:acyl-homoserine lactone acylase PvdQ
MNWKHEILNPCLGTILKAVLWPIGRLRLPQVQGSITLAGLVDPVEVLRDRWGIAHIFANNETDMVFAQGFVHAQERFGRWISPGVLYLAGYQRYLGKPHCRWTE